MFKMKCFLLPDYWMKSQKGIAKFTNNEILDKFVNLLNLL